MCVNVVKRVMTTQMSASVTFPMKRDAHVPNPAQLEPTVRVGRALSNYILPLLLACGQRLISVARLQLYHRKFET